VKGDHLGEFEELILLAIRAVGEDSYAVPVQRFVERTARRNVSLGAVYAALERLETKGLARSRMGEPASVQGGKARRLYDVTPAGRRALEDTRRVRELMWAAAETVRRS